MNKKKELAAQGRRLKPLINIGKNGMTSEQILHIEKVLKKKKLIKVRFNRAALENQDKKEILDELLKKTGAELIDFVGFNAVICKTGSPGGSTSRELKKYSSSIPKQ